MPKIVMKGAKPSPKPAATPAAAPAEEAPFEGNSAPEAVTNTSTPKPAAKPAASAAAPKPGLSFIKRGAAAQQEMQKEEKRIELARKDKVFRFWLPQDAQGDITFLDGNLKNGILDIPFYHEHQIQMNGSWNNFFICTQDEEPCPICEGGNNASYVGVLTVIDHREYESKGKMYKDQVRLFVAKRDTVKLLQDMATKRGGLRGCRYEVKRIGDKSPGVGSHFDFTEKYSEQQLQQMFGKVQVGDKTINKSLPINYDAYLADQYQPAKELRKLGFGAMGGSPVGSESAPEENYNY